MKLLHLYNLHRFRGGADRAALSTVELLQARGNDVRTISYDSRDLGQGLTGKISAFMNGIYAPEPVRRIEAMLSSFEPDVVHAHKLYPLMSPWVLRVAQQRGIPVVMSIYDYMLTCPVGTQLWNGAVCTRCADRGEHWGVIRNCRGRLAESVAYSLRHAVARQFGLYRDHVSRFVTPTLFSSRWLADHAGIPPGRIRTIPFSFSMPESAADPGRGGYIAYAGRFAAEKGMSTLMEAARRTGLPFRLAGDSAELRLADGLSNVELIHTRSRAELMEFYRGARVLVVPSVWFETFPLVIGEAMSHGIPVIASRIGGLPEFVQDGITGLLFEPGNAEELSEKIQQLWERPELARRLGHGARAYIGSECSESTFFERLKAVYSEVCHQPVSYQSTVMASKPKEGK